MHDYNKSIISWDFSGSVRYRVPVKHEKKYLDSFSPTAVNLLNLVHMEGGMY